MKKIESLAFKALQIWGILLLVLVLGSIVYSLVQVVTGNVQNTATFEF